MPKVLNVPVVIGPWVDESWRPRILPAAIDASDGNRLLGDCYCLVTILMPTQGNDLPVHVIVARNITLAQGGCFCLIRACVALLGSYLRFAPGCAVCIYLVHAYQHKSRNLSSVYEAMFLRD